MRQPGQYVGGTGAAEARARVLWMLIESGAPMVSFSLPFLLALEGVVEGVRAREAALIQESLTLPDLGVKSPSVCAEKRKGRTTEGPGDIGGACTREVPEVEGDEKRCEGGGQLSVVSGHRTSDLEECE